MFKQVFRLTFITYVWKQYKRAIVSTILLFLYLYLVGSMHEDYLNYARLEDSSQVGNSFLIKWAALGFGVLVFLAYHFLRRDKRNAGKLPPELPQTGEDDPFAEIRRKKKLRSKADMLIDRQSGDEH